MRTSILSFLVLSLTGFVAAGDFPIEEIYSARTKNNDTLFVNYNGTFTNGTLFDSSYAGNTSDPFSFKIGAGEVIKGWDLGLLNMSIGDIRKLTLPPQFAYGNRTVGPIPANSTLIFYAELVGIQGIPK